MEALKEPNLRLLSDLLATADGDLAIDVNKAYAEEKVNQLMIQSLNQRGSGHCRC